MYVKSVCVCEEEERRKRKEVGRVEIVEDEGRACVKLGR